ncbi:hypothetical protein [Kangiella spongicola]|uniref:hypothetical protein n=1 Tax=Kangiella spongicola TaxID=796379 RepID=UPI001D0EC927|nr:hypothetical protein [Kangiella spongicola]
MKKEFIKLKVFTLGALGLMLTACGGGGSSDSAEPEPPVSEAPTWTAGVYEDESNFVARCENPRSGNDINGNPWPDQQGSYLYEKH